MSATCSLFPPASWGPLVFLPVTLSMCLRKRKKKKNNIWRQKNVSKWLHWEAIIWLEECVCVCVYIDRSFLTTLWEMECWKLRS